jgi:hypothetical protein
MEDSPSIDFLMLADYAEIVGGKLYTMGGAWDRITVRDPAQPLRFAVVLAVMVPWNATNQNHAMQIAIADTDGTQQGILLESSFITGRPPDLRPGSTQRVLIAANVLIPAGAPGEYALVATIDGEERRRIAFMVLQGA